jgi:hypothetical protein
MVDVFAHPADTGHLFRVHLETGAVGQSSYSGAAQNPGVMQPAVSTGYFESFDRHGTLATAQEDPLCAASRMFRHS